MKVITLVRLMLSFHILDAVYDLCLQVRSEYDFNFVARQ